MNTEPMSDEAVAKRREYYKQWRAKNKSRVKAYNKNYWERLAKKTASEQGENNE